jgi:hypothetical protein
VRKRPIGKALPQVTTLVQSDLASARLSRARPHVPRTSARPHVRPQVRTFPVRSSARSTLVPRLFPTLSSARPLVRSFPARSSVRSSVRTFHARPPVPHSFVRSSARSPARPLVPRSPARPLVRPHVPSPFVHLFVRSFPARPPVRSLARPFPRFPFRSPSATETSELEFQGHSPKIVGCPDSSVPLDSNLCPERRMLAGAAA